MGLGSELFKEARDFKGKTSNAHKVDYVHSNVYRYYCISEIKQLNPYPFHQWENYKNLISNI